MGRRETIIRKKPRRIDIYEEREKNYYIFSEGEKTEPNYFNSFKKAIQQNPIFNGLVYVESIGIGEGTVKVVNAAKKYVEKYGISNAEVWCVFDKDDFSEKDFNEAIKLTQVLSKNKRNVRYLAAWSNQCIEYWFVIHFGKYEADNDRRSLCEFLSERMQKDVNKEYKKNDKDMFEYLLTYGNPELAIRNAKSRILDCKGKTPSKSTPATKVFELVLTLAQYLPEEMRSRFIK